MRLPVIGVEMHHWELLGESEQRADVVAVIVRRPHVIDLFDAGILQRLDDTDEIAVAGVAGIDQQRLARRAHEERRLPALGIDVINVQRSGPGLGRQTHDSNRQTQHNHDGGAHT
jgi:hypothetical protein